MFWFARPPYLRWAAAALVIIGAGFLEPSQRTTVPHPFAAAPIDAGTPLDSAAIEWRDVPAGLLPELDPTASITARAVAEGEPLVPTVLSDRSPIPEGWWSVPVPLPESAAPGTAVRIVVFEPAATIDGIVVSAGASSSFDIENVGMVAVPADRSAAVAAAAAAGELVVLLEP